MSPDRAEPKPPRRGTYLLPSFFTMANIFCGYLALTEVFEAGQLISQNLAGAAAHFDIAAKAIGFAVLFDGLDGRLARLTGTSSSFGQELDSIADAITFGIAPAFLALTWGVQAVLLPLDDPLFRHLTAAGWLVSFLFVLCSVSRLARFNIQSSPAGSHGAHPDHKYFVGLPTPASAGLVAAVVHANLGEPVREWLWTPFWFLVLIATSLLMISTWRYYSFKEFDLLRRRKFVVVVFLGTVVGLIWFYSQVFLLLLATTYVFSGIVAKFAHASHRGHMEAHPEERRI
ncbi:MAG: phosphatidylcholine/phosphatidylserine synthase [Acidobacteria bacterium]|nr:phosphatidylcholine/phosphatidylserine synthase [Acidobacteriota bacterium]